MTGLSNYSATNLLNYITGLADIPALPAAAYLALFTAAASDSSLSEPTSGSGYQRVQIAGSLSTTSGTVSGSPILNITGVPAWIQLGMLVTDATSGSVIPASTFVIAKGADTLTLSNALAGNVASGNSIRLTSFGISIPGTDTTPFSLANSAAIPFPQATPGGPGYGACPAFGIYDASGIGAGNLLVWDFFGQYLWAPFYSSSGVFASGAVFNQAANGYSNGNGVIVSAEFGGTLPTVIQGTLAGYALNYAANVTTDAFTLSSSPTTPNSGNAVWATNSGNGQARRVDVVNIPGGVTETIPANHIFISTFVTPAASLPLDKVTGAVAAYSFRKLRTAYAGHSIEARRSSDDATANFSFLNDNFDATAYQAFIGASSGFSIDWYDQSGHPNDAVQSDPANEPQATSGFGFYGNVGVENSTQLLEAPSGIASSDNIFSGGGSIYVVAEALPVAGSNARAICGKGGGSWAFYSFNTDGVNKLWLLQNGTSGLGFWNGQAEVTPGSLHILEIQYDNGPTNQPTFAIDGVPTTIENTNDYSGTVVSDADTGIQLFNASALGGARNVAWAGTIYEEYWFDRILSTQDRDTLIADIKAYYSIP